MNNMVYFMMQDLVPCILVTFDKEQIVIWRGKDYKPMQDGFLLADRELFDDPQNDMVQVVDQNYKRDDLQGPQNFDSADEWSDLWFWCCKLEESVWWFFLPNGACALLFSFVKFKQGVIGTICKLHEYGDRGHCPVLLNRNLNGPTLLICRQNKCTASRDYRIFFSRHLSDDIWFMYIQEA